MSTATSDKRITLEHVESVIVAESVENQPGTNITICVLSLRNGAKVVGINYGAIDPAQHSWETGAREARKQALDKVFELEGYLLRERLFEQNNSA